MKSLFNCHFTYQVTPKGNARTNFNKAIRPFNEDTAIQIESKEAPSKQQIKRHIEAEWSRKKITDRFILEIYSPEKIY